MAKPGLSKTTSTRISQNYHSIISRILVISGEDLSESDLEKLSKSKRLITDSVQNYGNLNKDQAIADAEKAISILECIDQPTGNPMQQTIRDIQDGLIKLYQE